MRLFVRWRYRGQKNQLSRIFQIVEEVLNELNEPFKAYAESIKIARNGNLKMSLKNLNEIIKKNKNNFLLETKADILFSYGYTKEATKFYRKNLEKYPLNYYARIRIFENIEIYIAGLVKPKPSINCLNV